jgi:gluconolactonase
MYAAETHTGRVFAWDLEGPGEIRPNALSANGGTLLAGLAGMQLLDSLAVDAEGNVCVATILNGGITIISPDGSSIEHVPTGDPLTTNICFGGSDRKTAYITCSGTGRLLATEWSTAGLELAYEACDSPEA